MNGMMDIRNRTQSSVADVVNKEPAVDDLERCGFHPTSPTPLNDELSTVVVFDADELLSDLLEELHYKSRITIKLTFLCTVLIYVLQNRSLSEQTFLCLITACSRVL